MVFKVFLLALFKVWRDLVPRFGLAVLVICCFLRVSPEAALSYKVSPAGTKLEQSIAKKQSTFWQRRLQWLTRRGVRQFTEPVHEEITNRIFGCAGAPKLCGDPDIGFASAYIIAGVRWNDDPPFQLEDVPRKTSCKITETIRFTTQPKCWAELFLDAKKKAAKGPQLNTVSHASLLARSHFGDLQFLHAMASEDGELARETKRRIMMWAQFTWEVNRGHYDLGTKLRDVYAPCMEESFGREEWTVQDLFTLGNRVLRPWIKEVAFGSLLHMVEDSFAKGHVDRAEAIFGAPCPGAEEYLAPGVIREFHSYINQDPAKHDHYDGRKALAAHIEGEKPNVVDVGQALLDYQRNGATWEEVKPFLDCVFALGNPEAKASAGAGFKKE